MPLISNGVNCKFNTVNMVNIDVKDGKEADTEVKWNRKPYCQVNGHKSSLKSVHCGIPQGSCLGPLLFILYVNDFEQCLNKCTSNMYADDTSVTCSAEYIDELFNAIRTEVGRWSHKTNKPYPWSIRGKHKWEANQTGQKC